MPEAPECKIIGEGLAKFVSQKTLTKITTLSGRYTKSPIPGIQLFQEPTKVIGVGVKAKLIFVLFENDTFLLSTLGMTGSWTSEKTKHSRVQFDFSDSSKVFFNDIRNFGTLKFIKGRKKLLEKLDNLGPDMLSEEISDDVFCERFSNKSHWTIAKAIMDQTVISGVGNYIKSECLYLAKISPKRTVGSLSTKDLIRLKNSIQQIMKLSYSVGGASLKDFSSFDKKKGEMSKHLKVYGKKVDPLGNSVIKETTDDGRSTFWVQNIQN